MILNHPIVKGAKWYLLRQLFTGKCVYFLTLRWLCLVLEGPPFEGLGRLKPEVLTTGIIKKIGVIKCQQSLLIG